MRWILALAVTAAAVFVIANTLQSPTQDSLGTTTTESTAKAERNPSAPSLLGAPSTSDLVDENDFTVREGPDLVVRGTVRVAGKPASAAKVTLRLHHPNEVPGFATFTRYGGMARRPLAAADITLAQTTTQTDGTFQLQVARRAVVQVHVRARGAAPCSKTLPCPSTGNPRPLLVDLHHGHAVSLRLLRNDRSPLASCAVTLLTDLGHNLDTSTDGTVLAREVTDTTGRVDFGMQCAGPVRLAIKTHDHVLIYQRLMVPTQGVATIVMPRTGTVALMTQRGKALATSAQVELRVSISEQAFAIVTGRSDQGGALVLLHAPVGSVAEVRAGIVDGLLASSRDGGVTHNLFGVLAAKTTSGTIQLPTTSQITGKLVGEPSTSIAGAAVSLWRRHSGIDDVLDTVRADNKGHFVFALVPHGRYAICARSMRAPDLMGEVDIPVLSDGTEVIVPMRGVGRVAGIVTPAPQGQVGLVRLRAGSSGMTTKVDEQGRFLFDAVAPSGRAVARLNNIESPAFAIVAGETTDVVISRPREPEVRGTVRDKDGAPIAGAYVRSERPVSWDMIRSGFRTEPNQPWSGVRTDVEGRFQLAVSDPESWSDDNLRNWTLHVAHPDFAPATVSDLGVPSLEQPIETDVTLAPSFRAQGRVIAEDGSPAVGAQVLITQHGVRHQAWTDAEGQFQATSIGKSGFAVTVRFGSQRVAGDKDFVSFAEAPTTDIQIQLRQVPLIAGYVVDDEGNPVANLRVSAQPPVTDEPVDERTEKSLANVSRGVRRRLLTGLSSYMRDVGRSTSDSHGYFEIVCKEPGTYHLVVWPSTSADIGHIQTVCGPFPTGTHESLIEVDTGVHLSGTVRDEDGAPVADARVIGAWPQPEGWDSGMTHSNYRPHATTDQLGNFTLKGLDEGRVDIVVTASGFDLLHEREVKTDQSNRDFVLTRGLSIQGRVVQEDNRAHAGLTLKITKQRDPDKKKARADILGYFKRQRTSPQGISGSAWLGAPGNGQKETITETDGSFTFWGVPPGRYRITINTPMLGPEDPIVPPTNVQAGAQSVEIQTRKALTVSGQLVDPDGKPATHHWGRGHRFANHVSASQSDDHKARGAIDAQGRNPWDLVDARGRFHIGGLLPGPVTVHARGGDAWHSVTIETTAGTQDLVLVMKPISDEDRQAKRRAVRDIPVPPQYK